MRAGCFWALGMAVFLLLTGVRSGQAKWRTIGAADAAIEEGSGNSVPQAKKALKTMKRADPMITAMSEPAAPTEMRLYASPSESSGLQISSNRGSTEINYKGLAVTTKMMRFTPFKSARFSFKLFQSIGSVQVGLSCIARADREKRNITIELWKFHLQFSI